jgi:CHASE2 domain-containing sensor protein
MRNKLITDYTDEALIKSEKKLKTMTIMLGISIILLFFATIALMLMKGFTPIMIIPICLFPLLIVNIINWQNLKKEKERRSLQ